MQIEPSGLDGALSIVLPFSTDNRGSFTKTFHETTLKNAGICFDLKESYFSFSGKDVIRGMHFQTPPSQHSKIVFCPVGAILDVIIDLRKSSPTYGKHCSAILSADNHKAYFIPEGFAHGFKSLSDNALTYYLVSSEYNQASDAGVAYNSFGFDWQANDPILSVRDKSFPALNDFVSPF